MLDSFSRTSRYDMWMWMFISISIYCYIQEYSFDPSDFGDDQFSLSELQDMPPPLSISREGDHDHEDFFKDSLTEFTLAMPSNRDLIVNKGCLNIDQLMAFFTLLRLNPAKWTPEVLAHEFDVKLEDVQALSEEVRLPLIVPQEQATTHTGDGYWEIPDEEYYILTFPRKFGQSTPTSAVNGLASVDSTPQEPVALSEDVPGQTQLEHAIPEPPPGPRDVLAEREARLKAQAAEEAEAFAEVYGSSGDQKAKSSNQPPTSKSNKADSTLF